MKNSRTNSQKYSNILSFPKGANIIKEYTDDPLYYLPVIEVLYLGRYYGTNWDYVLTDVKLEIE